MSAAMGMISPSTSTKLSLPSRISAASVALSAPCAALPRLGISFLFPDAYPHNTAKGAPAPVPAPLYIEARHDDVPRYL